MNEPHLTLARWVCDLNGWRWPSDFPVAKPDGYDELPNRDRAAATDKYRIAMPYINAVRMLVPPKEVLRYHNCINRRAMSNEQFEEWYASAYAVPASPVEDADEPLLVAATGDA